MFHTLPASELHIPRGLAPNGERAWRWIEFGLHTEYFMVTLVEDTTEESFARVVILDGVRMLQSLIEQDDAQFRIERVQLLSPFWMNGHGRYELDEVRQIWTDDTLDDCEFVLTNGKRYLTQDHGGSTDHSPSSHRRVLWDGPSSSESRNG